MEGQHLEGYNKAPPLTLETVSEAIKGVRSLRELGRHLLGHHGVQKQDDIQCQHFYSQTDVKDMMEAFLLGNGDYQPSWRRVIHALYKADKGHLGDHIKHFAESVQDTTLTVDNVSKVMYKIQDLNKWKVMGELGIQHEQIQSNSTYSTDEEKICACAAYYVKYSPHASWKHLLWVLYVKKEFAAARKSKSFIATDPTFTVENIDHILVKVEPKERLSVLRTTANSFRVEDVMLEWSLDSEKECVFVDIYVNCNPLSSWVDLAKALYQCEQLAALAEVRKYLPPKDLTITTEKLKDLFVSLNRRREVDELGHALGLPLSEREKIKRDYQSPIQRKEAYLDHYVYHHCYPTWILIASLLRHRFKLIQQADLVEDTYIKVSQMIQQNFDTAMMEGELLIQNGSLLLLGPGGSGKTHTLALFLEEDPPSIRESTACVKKPIRAIADCSVRAVTHCKVGMSNDHFVRITDDQYSDMFVGTAEQLLQSYNTVNISKPNTGVEIHNLSRSLPPLSLQDKIFNKVPAVEVNVLQMEEAWCTHTLKRELQCRMQTGVKKLNLNNKDMLNISDTGGQPMFHEILPVFIHNTMFGIFTVKLNESLDSYPLVEYYVKGKCIGEPFYSPFTHLETFQHCMRVIQSTCDLHKCPKIAFVGTHKDLEYECPHEKKEVKNKRLQSIIPKKLMGNVLVHEGSLLLAINAKCPGKTDQEVMSFLRDRIATELHTLKPDRIPLRYVALEMAFQRLAKDQQKSVLSKEECFKVASAYNFTQTSFETALMYLHELKLIFYYEKILPNVVFIDAQALLDKITELVVYSLSLQPESTSGLLGALQKFKMCGIVTLEILSEFKSHYVPKLFMKEELITLLIYLRIMAKVGKGEYLMPCLLKRDSLPVISDKFSSSQVVSSLLFYFGGDGPKLGVFCFLLTYLISEAKWELLEEDGYPVQLSRNRVEFAPPGGNPGCITLTDSFSTYFHVVIEPPEDISAARFHQVCKELCPIICETILTGIRKVSQKLNYKDSICEAAFPCLKHKGLHPAIISGTGLLTCTTNSRFCSEMSPQHHLWLGCKDTDNPKFQREDGFISCKDASCTVSDTNLDATPTLGKLFLLKNLRKKIRIIETVTPKWQRLGDQLEFDRSGTKLAVIKATHPTDPEACCRDMFQHWLNGNGVRPCSWRKLVELLEDCDLDELAAEVQSVFIQT